LARRLGPATVVRGGIPAMAAALVASAFAGDLAALFVALACFGTLGAIVDVAMNTIAVAVERDRRRPLMSGFHGAWSVGLLRGPPAAGAPAAAGLAPRGHFSIVAIVAAGVAVTILAAPPRRPSSPARAGRHGRTPWSAELVVLGAIAFCSFFAEGAAADW